MQTIGLADLQKNIWILTTLLNPIKVLNKRNNTHVATVYPVIKKNRIANLAWKYSKKILKDCKKISIDNAVEIAMNKSLKDKYAKNK